MKSFFKSELLSVGLAMFSMFFGAGNIVYPLAVGQYAGDKNLFAIAGLILTAAMMPIAGVIAMILYDGSYKDFFYRLGKIPGFALALTMISLLGPLGSTPRCIALSYTTLTHSFLDASPAVFSAFSCILIFFFTINKKRILELLGILLTPLLLLSLFLIIVIGLATAPAPHSVLNVTHFEMFLKGLKEGYNTMDLLAAFFFSSTIIHVLKMQKKEGSESDKSYVKVAFEASLIGAFLLSLVYLGFSYISSFHAGEIGPLAQDQLLSAITLKIAGKDGGILVCVAIALACLTTAIALISAFADFVQTEVCNNKVSYKWIVFFSLIATFFVSTFEFTGISAFLWPILQICYPGLIALTLLNIAHKTCGFRPIKWPVFLTFAFSAIVYFMNL